MRLMRQTYPTEVKDTLESRAGILAQQLDSGNMTGARETVDSIRNMMDAVAHTIAREVVYGNRSQQSTDAR